MKKFPILYKKDQNGNIREWEISTLFNKVITIHGCQGGKKQKDIFECFGKNIGKKNETSNNQQAELEAESIFQKKIEQEGYISDISQINDIKFSPMLAQTFEEKRIKEFPWLIQRKYDGVRCNCVDGKMLSRKGKEFFNLEHLKDKIEKINNKFGIILDGELYNHEMEFEKIVSLIKRKMISEELGVSPLKKDLEKIKYNVYDFYDTTYDLSQHDRISMLEHEIRNFIIENDWQDFIEISPTYKVNSFEEIEKYMIEFTSTGYEGSILRDPSAKYEFRRVYSLLKCKREMDEEFKIVDVIDGKGREKGLAIFVCEVKGSLKYYGAIPANATTTFNVRPMGSHESRKEIFKNKEKYIGKLYTVIFFSYTKYGIPRFPRGKAVRDYE